MRISGVQTFRLRSLALGPLFLLLIIVLPCQNTFAAPRFGLWVEAEGENQPFRSRSEYETFLEFSANKHFTDLYCQVYRGGRSWFPSMMADDAPYRQALSFGVDPLRETIDKAHRRGQRVHAWVNALRVNRNQEAPLLRTVGSEALQRDGIGNTVLDYDDDGYGAVESSRGFRLETPGVWLDPSSKGVRQFVVEAIRDIVTTYPDIDGIHLDMVRYPATLAAGGGASRPDFGYSNQSLQAFYEFAGRTPPERTAQLCAALRHSPAWSAWRRAQVTLLVFEIKEMLNEIAPEVELSAAVIASPDRAYSEMFQDWTQWLRGGVLDTAIPMNYARDNVLVAQQSQHAVRAVSGGHILIGLGAWLFKGNPAALAAQGKSALQAGAKGVVLFSYSNMDNAPGRELVRSFFESVDPAGH